MIDRIARAAILASEIHFGQKRDGSGEPFVQHPIRVAGRIAAAAAGLVALERLPSALFEAALLHDAIEDGPTDAGSMVFDVCGADVWDLVLELTDGDWFSRGQRHVHQARRVGAAPPIVALVKFADKADNLASMRASELPAERALRYCDGAELVGAACWRRLSEGGVEVDGPLWQVGNRLRDELEREIATTRAWAAEQLAHQEGAR